MKPCRICGLVKPLDDYYRHDGAADGRRGDCIECNKVKTRRRYLENRERNRQIARDYYHQHRDARRAYGQQWYADNRERQVKKQRQWNDANRDKIKRYRVENREAIIAYKRQRYAENRERIAAETAAWRERNPEKVIAYRRANQERAREAARRYRTRKLAAWVEDIDDAVVWERDGGLCGICGEPCDAQDVHIDHIVPVSKGGEHSYANVQLAHPLCNRRKGARLPEAA